LENAAGLMINRCMILTTFNILKSKIGIKLILNQNQKQVIQK